VATTLLQSLILASAGILSVGSITLVILLLISDRGWHNGLGYALGYTSAYTVIGVSVVTLGYRTAENNTDEPNIVLPIIMIVLGSLLIWLSLKNWRKPAPQKKKEPRFFSIVNKITPLKAFGFGAMVSVINFKNLALFLSALSVVILSDLLITEKITITLLVVLVFCLSVIIPVLIFVIFPQKANHVLNGIKETLEKNSRPIGIWLPLLFGLIFLLKGITGLL
jgi:threonine/homoserine/homoserine lactone efflux protein